MTTLHRHLFLSNTHSTKTSSWQEIFATEALANLTIISRTQMKVGLQCMLVIINVFAIDLSQRAMEPCALSMWV